MSLIGFLLIIPVILLAVVIHELSHAWVADRLGDNTPRLSGRLTLNPIAHLDLVGTLVLLLTQRFGWAKPVPVNPYNFADPRKDLALVGAAGPASNLILSYLLGYILKMGMINPHSFLGIFFSSAIQLNIGLAIFNLIPIPPLDGSKILMGILPEKHSFAYARMEQYGPLILILLLFFGQGLIRAILIPILNLLFQLFTGYSL